MKENAFQSVMTGMKQALRHAKGDEVGITHQIVVKDHDVRKIRIESGFSQSQFASSIGVSVATLRNWEQGKRKPNGAARVLLALLEQDPKIVQKTLAQEP